MFLKLGFKESLYCFACLPGHNVATAENLKPCPELISYSDKLLAGAYSHIGDYTVEYSGDTRTLGNKAQIKSVA